MRMTLIDEVCQSALHAMKAMLSPGATPPAYTIQPADLVMQVDPRRLRQILIHLLSNAIKFSPSNSVIILEVEETENSTKFAIKDYGNGISKSDIPILFEKFTQARSEEQSKQSGFGLGLSICKDIIERHGGSIGVTSEIGQGSTFWFTLPKNTSHKV